MQVTTYIKNSITKQQIRGYLEGSGARNISIYDNQLRSTCPIHNGDNPTAFAYDLEKHLWMCFTGDCGGGDIFDLVEKISGFSFNTFADLITYTATLFSINISGMNLDVRREQIQQENQRWLQYMSKKKHKNSEYDISNIGELERIDSYRDFEPLTLERFKISYSVLYNRIVVPLHDEEGHVVGITMRRCDESEKIKWLHKPRNIDTGEILFNYPVGNHVDLNYVYVTEGVFDAIKTWQNGTDSVVACLGSHLTETQEKMLLKRYTTIILAYDNDKAGRAATVKAIERLKFKADLYVLDLENFKDPGEVETQMQFNSLKHLKWYEWLRKYKDKIEEEKRR
jgi:DNA primase